MRLAPADMQIRCGTSSGFVKQIGISVQGEALMAASPSSGNH